MKQNQQQMIHKLNANLILYGLCGMHIIHKASLCKLPG